MVIAILRHGECFYKQGEATLALANDLTFNGICQIQSSTKDLIQIMNLPGAGEVKISSSPFSRCLHSAKTLGETLSSQGIRSKIEVDQRLSEVKNLDYNLYTFLVNKELTNPLGHSPTEYFREGCAHNLSYDARQTLSKELVEKINSIEKYSEATQRLEQVVKSLDPLTNHILITHEGLIGNYSPSLEKGKYIILGGEND